MDHVRHDLIHPCIVGRYRSDRLVTNRVRDLSGEKLVEYQPQCVHVSTSVSRASSHLLFGGRVLKGGEPNTRSRFDRSVELLVREVRDAKIRYIDLTAGRID